MQMTAATAPGPPPLDPPSPPLSKDPLTQELSLEGFRAATPTPTLVLDVLTPESPFVGRSGGKLSPLDLGSPTSNVSSPTDSTRSYDPDDADETNDANDADDDDADEPDHGEHKSPTRSSASVKKGWALAWQMDFLVAIGHGKVDPKKDTCRPNTGRTNEIKHKECKISTNVRPDNNKNDSKNRISSGNSVAHTGIDSRIGGLRALAMMTLERRERHFENVSGKRACLSGCVAPSCINGQPATDEIFERLDVRCCENPWCPRKHAGCPQCTSNLHLLDRPMKTVLCDGCRLIAYCSEWCKLDDRLRHRSSSKIDLSSNGVTTGAVLRSECERIVSESWTLFQSLTFSSFQLPIVIPPSGSNQEKEMWTRETQRGELYTALNRHFIFYGGAPASIVSRYIRYRTVGKNCCAFEMLQRLLTSPHIDEQKVGLHLIEFLVTERFLESNYATYVLFYRDVVSKDGLRLVSESTMRVFAGQQYVSCVHCGKQQSNRWHFWLCPLCGIASTCPPPCATAIHTPDRCSNIRVVLELALLHRTQLFAHFVP